MKTATKWPRPKDRFPRRLPAREGRVKTDDQGATMASVGQEDTQAPQSTHTSGSIQRAPFFSLIALVGHSLSHAPQLTHASVILYAMSLPLDTVDE